MIDSERVYTEVTSKFPLWTSKVSLMFSIDEILKRYDEKYEMTWDMKAGLMGKRKCCYIHRADLLSPNAQSHIHS
jgi:pseudouridine-5'-monophosphatase